MNHNIYYRTFKLSLGFVLALTLAEILGLNYPVSAGVIALLNLLDTKKDSLKVSWRRFYSSIIGLSLSAIIFSLAGFHPLSIGLMLLVFIPITSKLKAKEGVIINVVLASHLIDQQSIAISTLLNELYLISLGGFVALILSAHMPNRMKHLLSLKETVDDQIHGILLDFGASVINEKSLDGVSESFEILQQNIKQGKKLSYEQMNNSFFTEQRYYIEYFQMRLIQSHRLNYMSEHLKMIFVAEDQAQILSDFFIELALNYKEANDGKQLLAQLETIKTELKTSSLPQTRPEFEHRAALFQMISDLESFIKTKFRFIEQHGLSNTFSK